MGSWIVCAEFKEDENGKWCLVCVKAGWIDGEKMKADTYYSLKGGEFIEA